ncbi:MAG: efflux transporter outer membrane subunit [Rudaea sp.]|nr:efflux transporter outer membrane subunit [Rudaea sp.]
MKPGPRKDRTTPPRGIAQRTLLLAIVAAVAGCTMHTSLPTLPDQTPETWRTDGASVANGLQPDLQHWWHAFGDATLDALVDRALQDNLGIAVAELRLRAARRLQHRARTDFWPNLNFRVYEETAPGAATGYLEIGFDAEWEFGLFGRSQGSARMAAADVNTAIVDATSARVSVIAEVAKNYVELRAAQARAEILDEVVAQRRRRVELMQTRLRTHMASQMEVDHERTDLQQALAESGEPGLSMQQTMQALAVLLGTAEPDAGWSLRAGQPLLPALDIHQAPADLVRTRPEIRRAEQNALHAAGELGIARADLFPKLGLVGTLISSTSITGDVDHPNRAVPLLGPNIQIPLWDWGARRDVVGAREAALSASVLAYREAVLEGVAEAEAALAQFANRTARLDNAQASVALAQQSQASARTLQRLGLGDGLETSSAGIALAEARLGRIAALRDRALAYIAVYKAFGGVLPPLAAVPR